MSPTTTRAARRFAPFWFITFFMLPDYMKKIAPLTVVPRSPLPHPRSELRARLHPSSASVGTPVALQMYFLSRFFIV